MKKLVVMILTLTMLFSLGIHTLAADSQTDYSLVAHWDFEGDDPLADKATAGKSNDTLTVNGDNVIVAGGVAFVPTAAANYLSAAGVGGTDLFDMTNVTIMARMKIVRPATAGRTSGIYGKQEIFSYGLSAVKPADGVSTPNAVQFQYYPTATGAKTSMSGTGILELGDWRVYAITFTLDESTGNTIVRQYMSKNEIPQSAEDYVLVNEFTELINLKGEGDFIIGKRQDYISATQNDRYTDAYIDEVKIFSGVLGAEQLALESPKTAAGTQQGDTTDTDVQGPTVKDTDTDTETDTDIDTDSDTDDQQPSGPVIPGGLETKDDTQESSDTDAASDTADDESKGCGATLSVSALAIAMLATGLVIKKKQEEN